jgi:tight adherence protein B
VTRLTIHRTVRAAVAVSAITCVLMPSAANAAGRARIIDVSTTAGKLRVVVSASGLARGTTIDPTSVQLSIDGTTLSSQATPVSSAPAKVSRSAMLVIDTSGSMSGEGLNGAKSAADAFLSSVPSDVRVGLVAFSDRAQVLVAPTTTRGDVRSAISRLKANGETALYDGVSLALQAVKGAQLRNIILLTDGADTRSKIKLSALLPAIRASKTTIDAVGFRTTDSESAPLRQIASSGSGAVVAAGASSALADAFHAAAQEISNQVVAVATVPKQFANGSHTIKVNARAGSETLTDSVFTLVGAASATPSGAQSNDFGPQAVAVHKGLSRPALIAGLLALFLAAALLLAIALTAFNREDKRSGVRRRLSIYTLTGRPVEESREESNAVLGDSAVARSAVEFAGRVVASRDLESVLGRKLDAAGVPMKAPEWMILHVGIAVAAGLLLLLISGGGLVATLVGVCLGLALPWLYLSFKDSRRTAAFLERMPDTLQLMAGGLRSGYSLPQSIDAVVREGSEPVASEFNRALIETRLGVSIEDALEGVGTRMRSVDFDWVVMAVRIQREVGGNLAEVLTTVAATLRERERLRRQVRVLSAEGRLSAWILGGLPPLFFLYMLLVRQDYIRVLWTDPIGIALIIALIVDLTLGIFWLRKVIHVEV